MREKEREREREKRYNVEISLVHVYESDTLRIKFNQLTIVCD